MTSFFQIRCSSVSGQTSQEWPNWTSKSFLQLPYFLWGFFALFCFVGVFISVLVLNGLPAEVLFTISLLHGQKSRKKVTISSHHIGCWLVLLYTVYKLRLTRWPWPLNGFFSFLSFKALGESTDFSKKKSLDVVERFLISCSEDSIQQHQKWVALIYCWRVRVDFSKKKATLWYGYLTDLRPVYKERGLPLC